MPLVLLNLIASPRWPPWPVEFLRSIGRQSHSPDLAANDNWVLCRKGVYILEGGGERSKSASRWKLDAGSMSLLKMNLVALVLSERLAGGIQRSSLLSMMLLVELLSLIL